MLSHHVSAGAAAQCRQARSRTAVVAQVASPARSAAAGGAIAAALLLTSGTSSADSVYEQQLRAIVKEHSGADLVVPPSAPATGQAGSFSGRSGEAPPVKVEALGALPRKERIRADALSESQAASQALAAAQAPAASSGRLGQGASLDSRTVSAALSMLGVLGSAAGAAYLLTRFNNSLEATEGLVGTGPLPGTGTPPPEMPLLTPDESEPVIVVTSSDARDRSPTAAQ